LEKKIDKRTFLKQSGLGACGLFLGLGGMHVLGSEIRNIPTAREEKLWKWSREAEHYIETPKGIKCKLCPQACELKEDETGDCRTRVVKENRLYSIAYGNPCAVHIDPIEKKPLNHFLPGSKAFSIATAGCNLACLNCQNWNISQLSPKDTNNYDLMPDRVVQECHEASCTSIAYTYSDPVAFYEYTVDTAKIAKQEGIKNVLISAGYINETPLREMAPFIDGANIDLKSFSNETYEMLNAGTLDPVLRTLKILREMEVWLEITNLVVPSWTDDMDMIREMCDWLVDNGFASTPLHFSRFHPTYKLTNLPATPVDTLKKALTIAKSAGIHYVYIGNVPASGAENTQCPSCGKTVIERRGYRILSKNLNKNQCAACGEVITGVWE
jgi:pyruvate formate lyase activating enzyme